MRFDPEGDIFRTGARCIVNPVNCHGVMGAGLARAFARRFPEIMPPYTAACASGKFVPGGVQLIGIDASSGARRPRAEADLIVANLATKDHWRAPSRIEWVERGLGALAGRIAADGIESVAIPKLGAGLGGLDWETVGPCVVEAFAPLARSGVDVTVLGAEPRGRGPRRDDAMPTPSADAPRYAGIGARKTPPDILDRMAELGEEMARRGWVLRSGAADGADQAFERGAREAGGACEIYLPWAGFQGRDGHGPGEHVGVDGAALELAQAYHPAWSRLGRGAQALMARNAYQVLGPTLDRPVRTVVCWTQDGRIAGGTGQALRMARHHRTDVVNLGVPALSRRSVSELADRIASGPRRAREPDAR